MNNIDTDILGGLNKRPEISNGNGGFRSLTGVHSVNIGGVCLKCLSFGNIIEVNFIGETLPPWGVNLTIFDPYKDGTDITERTEGRFGLQASAWDELFYILTWLIMDFNPKCKEEKEFQEAYAGFAKKLKDKTSDLEDLSKLFHAILQSAVIPDSEKVSKEDSEEVKKEKRAKLEETASNIVVTYRANGQPEVPSRYFVGLNRDTGEKFVKWCSIGKDAALTTKQEEKSLEGEEEAKRKDAERRAKQNEQSNQSPTSMGVGMSQVGAMPAVGMPTADFSQGIAEDDDDLPF